MENDTILSPSSPAGSRKIGQSEFNGILASHEEWLKNQDGGSRANLALCDLTQISMPPGVDLSGAELTLALLPKKQLVAPRFDGANMAFAEMEGVRLQTLMEEAGTQNNPRINRRGPSFKGANLTGTNLSGALLQEADFSGANVFNTKLFSANLRNATFENSKHLIVSQLQGANVACATLPESVSTFDALSVAAEIVKNAKWLFGTLLAACLYCAIAASNSSTVESTYSGIELPFSGIKVPIDQFFLYTPLLLFLLFLYFQIYLQRLWENLSILPAFFPDGRPLDRKINPWFLTILVRKHSPLLKTTRLPFGNLQFAIAIVAGWCVVPLTLLYLWLSYIRSHSNWLTLLHIASASILTASSISFYRTASMTLRGDSPKNTKFAFLSRGAAIASLCGLFVAVALFVATIFLTQMWCKC